MRNTSYQKTRRTREQLIKHLKSFHLDLKVSVGIWYFAPGGGRFHERYVPEQTIAERLEVAAEMAKFGVRAIEAHYPSEANEENVHLYKRLEKQTGIKLIMAGPFIFYSKDYEFGSLSNPIEKHRAKAQQTLVNCLRFARAHGLSHVGIWPGIDGYTVSIGHNFFQMWDNFEAAVAEAMDEVPGVRLALEPKPYEPAPNNIYRTTADGLLAVRDIEARLKNRVNRQMLKQGCPLVGMQPEVGHIRMGFEDTAYCFARILREGRLFHTHWNSQPLGNYDQDLNIGAVSPEDAMAALFVLKAAGYKEYFGVDINPERIPVLKAIEINCRALRILNEHIERLPFERVVDCYFDPENHRGDLEMILLENLRCR